MEEHSQALVSVVIPCYNHEQFVQDTIQSVIDQTYQNIELIIIDDGSKDTSVEKIQQMTSICEARFTRFEFRSRPNKGLSATLNESLEWCKGKYYSAIASDDMMLKDKTAQQVEILSQDEDYVAVFGAVEMIDNHNNKLGQIRQTDKIFSFNDLFYTDRFLPAPTQMIRLDSLKKTGGFVEGMIIEDWYMYLKLMEHGGKIYYKDDLYSYYRAHDGNTFSNPYKMALGRLQVINEFNHKDKFKHVYIKACWDNSLETLRTDFKLSSFIFLSRVVHKVKLFFTKIGKRLGL